MKKIFSLLGILILLSSCNNQEIEFDDFEFQAIYFPYQTPVRTIMLGDEVVGDNTIDLEHAFSLGVAIGGMYKNEMEREVAVELVEDLALNILNSSTGDTLEILPENYYTATFDRITIPKGSFNGKMRVELEDAFFQDPDANKVKYVLPVRITDAFGDSVFPITFQEYPDEPERGIKTFLSTGNLFMAWRTGISLVISYRYSKTSAVFYRAGSFFNSVAGKDGRVFPHRDFI